MGCVFCKTVSREGGNLPERQEDDGIVRVSVRREGKEKENEKEKEKGNEKEKMRLSRRRLSQSIKTQVGWPDWLTEVAAEAIEGWMPRRADSFEKLNKIGQGTYSNVYKARDLITGKIVALKKVRFDNLEPMSVKFMAREILVLRKLDHPNVIKLEGLVTSRMSCSLYLVFEYMEHDLAGLAASAGMKFSEPQVKCYMKQLLSGLEHCHNRGVLHRDVKGSNLLLDNEGVLKIADFGLASFFSPDQKQPMTSRVVTLWYRPPELLLGSTSYGVGVDLWSAGCILAELLAGKPIMPGRTEVEQLHKIFKLCGSPREEYWKKNKLPHATIFKPQHPYKRCIAETFKDFPPSSLSLVETLLSIDPDERGTTTTALNSEFFTTEPYACEPISLPKYPPSKELDVKLRDQESRKKSGASGKRNGDGTKKSHTRHRVSLAFPAQEANAKLRANADRKRQIAQQANVKSKSEKFPPPHEDGAVGYHIGPALSGAPDFSFNSLFLGRTSSVSSRDPGGTSSRSKAMDDDPHMAPSRRHSQTFRHSSTLRSSSTSHFKNLRIKENDTVSELADR